MGAYCGAVMLRARRGNALHEALPEGACVGEIFVEVRIAVGAFRRLVKERDIVARVIGELVGVAGVKRFGSSEDGSGSETETVYGSDLLFGKLLVAAI